ncbi:MAG: phosphatase PAP2 family protein [Elusimicrobiales bacterium]|nr:phosphatase PAP2 family protein [Elusimicrobiales bacterium]
MLLRQTAFILRSFIAALILAAGFAPAVHAGEAFYSLQPRTVSVKAPEAPAPAAVAVEPAPRYLSQSELQISGFPAPPAIGSAEDKADLAAVLQWQKDRTGAQCAAAMAQSDESYLSLFGGVNPFPVPLPPEVGAFFKRVGTETGDAVRNIKKTYKRERPFVRSAEVQPCLGRVQGLSYPSGHAAVARVYALVLSGLLPRQGAIFNRAADQAALNRVIGGVHHPTDVEAGKKLGELLFSKFRQNPAFAADMSGLSKYLRRQ